MTAQTDPYVRVYYRIVEDDRFADVYPDDRALACWLRLLIIADGAFPAPGALPRGVNETALQRLVTAGLIDRVGRDHFRVHGLESERARRSESGRKAAAVRWGQPETPPLRPDANAMRPHAAAYAPALQVHPTASSGAMHSAPILSEPLQSEPLHSTPSPSTGSENKKTTKKPPEDEERLMRYVTEWMDPATKESRRELLKTQLGFLGVHDIPGEARRLGIAA